jgi:hypothetical protein
MVLAVSTPLPLVLAAVAVTGGVLYHLWLRQRAALGKPVYVHLLRLAAIVALGWALGCAVVLLLAWLVPAP